MQTYDSALIETQTMAPKQKEGAYTAVVSGASGFIGTELVKQLLEKGYNVRGTVRSTSNTDKIQHLTKLAEVRHRCTQTSQALACMLSVQLPAGAARDIVSARSRSVAGREF